ncbi:MAG: M67 family metallopeptidase [Cyanobacteria bacterium J06576_12]
MVLALSQSQLLEMEAHAERVYPEECCGLIVGNLDSLDDKPLKSVVEIVSLDNEWTPDALPSQPARTSTPLEVSTVDPPTKRRRYWIDPKDMLRVQREAREKGLNVIGIYHSHPDHVAEPSECDRTLAWPVYSYVIVSVCEGKAVDVQNWALDSKHQFQAEPIQQIERSCSANLTQSATAVSSTR